MMKSIRKWSRILHRDIGFFFIGTTIVYGLSGIALNHLHDWNPNYTVELKNFSTKIDLNKEQISDSKIEQLLKDIDAPGDKRKYYYPQEGVIKIFLSGGSSVVVNTSNGEGQAEFLEKRMVFYQVNFLHYNPHNWWKWFSDIFAGALILFALTGLLMVRGKNGPLGWGGVYTIAGIVIPILFLIFL